MNVSEGPSDAWAAVVEADGRFTEAVLAIPRDELKDTLAWALRDFSSRHVALRILISAHPHLTSAALPALEPLLLVSHPLLDECRTLALRLPPAERSGFLRHLTAKVTGDATSDYEAYRRLAELLRAAGASEDLADLLNAASQSDDPDIKEVEEDFA